MSAGVKNGVHTVTVDVDAKQIKPSNNLLFIPLSTVAKLKKVMMVSSTKWAIILNQK